VPQPTDEQRQRADDFVQGLIDHTGKRHARRRAVLDWLKEDFGVEKPSLKR
jgi:hypothetical protein